jgi:hypothetical protein
MGNATALDRHPLTPLEAAACHFNKFDSLQKNFCKELFDLLMPKIVLLPNKSHNPAGAYSYWSFCLASSIVCHCKFDVRAHSIVMAENQRQRSFCGNPGEWQETACQQNPRTVEH